MKVSKQIISNRLDTKLKNKRSYELNATVTSIFIQTTFRIPDLIRSTTDFDTCWENCSATNHPTLLEVVV
jgi:hypothetical protein